MHLSKYSVIPHSEEYSQAKTIVFLDSEFKFVVFVFVVSIPFCSVRCIRIFDDEKRKQKHTQISKDCVNPNRVAIGVFVFE